MAHECRQDGSPCFGLSACYGHLKAQALNGGRDRLTDQELEFVGVVSRRRDTSGGWHQPGNLSVYELDADLSAEDTAVLQSLMMIGHGDRVDFLG